MPGRFGPTYLSSWMDTLATVTMYMTLFNNDPLTTMSPETFELGGLTSRQLATFTRSGYNSWTLSNKLTFLGIDPGTNMVAVGAFDDEFAGELVFSDLFRDETGAPTPMPFPTGGGFVIPPSEYVIGLDIPFTIAP